MKCSVYGLATELTLRIINHNILRFLYYSYDQLRINCKSFKKINQLHILLKKSVTTLAIKKVSVLK